MGRRILTTLLAIVSLSQLIVPLVIAERCVISEYADVENATVNCSEVILDTISVPAGKTLKLDLLDGAQVVFKGYISFEVQNWLGPLIAISGNNVTVRGEPSAIIDGSGHYYWDGQGGWSNVTKPQFFTIQASNSVFSDIRLINTPQGAVEVNNSNNVLFTDWIIDNLAGDPGVAAQGKEGHNTDGFDIWNSTNIEITRSQIYNQDDCVAVRCGANISVSNLYCHGSHGLSISAGFSNDSTFLNTVTNVSFTDSIMESGRNGIHIKTHVDGGNGNITGVVYSNIVLIDVKYNGILIEENYRNRPPSPSLTDVEPKNNVPIRDLVVENITGNVTDTAIPVEIICAAQGCFDWKWSGIQVKGGKKNSCNFQPSGFSC